MLKTIMRLSFIIFAPIHTFHNWICFNNKVTSLVKNHKIMSDNTYTKSFSNGRATHDQQKELVQQFSIFSQFLSLAQFQNIINAPTVLEMRERKELLYNTLGVSFSIKGTIHRGIYRHSAAHYEWLLDFGSYLGLEFKDMGRRELGNSHTQLFCDELQRLYGTCDDVTSLAASYAFEQWAGSGFWDDLIIGFEHINIQRDMCNEDTLPLTFWKINSELNFQHSQYTHEKLKNAYLSGSIIDEKKFLDVCENMLDIIYLFWMGLNKIQ